MTTLHSEEYQLPPNLRELQTISEDSMSQYSRGGFFHPRKDIWIPEDFPEVVSAESHDLQKFLDAMSAVALLAGRLHLRQLQDAKEGRIWPLQWLQEPDSDAFCRALSTIPIIGSPYVAVELSNKGQILTRPFSHQYRFLLESIAEPLRRAMALPGTDRALLPYFHSLQLAFAFDERRDDDRPYYAEADKNWVEISPLVSYLVLAEFSESYSDPLQQAFSKDTQLLRWLKEHGVEPWKYFFEFRVLRISEALTLREVTAIRKTNEDLYRRCEKPGFKQLGKASFEARDVLIVAGHSAFPPRTGKNYPNDRQIRESLGYKTIVYINSLRGLCKRYVALLKDNLPGCNLLVDDKLVKKVVRGHVLAVAGHEESHPWLNTGVAWFEEFKSTILGINSIIKSQKFSGHDIECILLAFVGAGLDLYLEHHRQLQTGKYDLEAYYVGATIMLEWLRREGVIVSNEEGGIVSLEFARFSQTIDSLANQVIAVVRDGKDPNSLKQTYFDEEVWHRFPNLDSVLCASNSHLDKR